MYNRYADDSVAFWNGSIKNLYLIKDSCARFLKEDLKLELAEDKTLITDVDKGFEYLGFHFRRGLTGNSCKENNVKKYLPIIDVPWKKNKKFRENINKFLKQATRRGYDSIYATLKVNEILRAFYQYYKDTTFRGIRFCSAFEYAKSEFRYFLRRRGLKNVDRFLKTISGRKTFVFDNGKRLYWIVTPPKGELPKDSRKHIRNVDCDSNGKLLSNGSRFPKRKMKSKFKRLFPNDPIVPMNADWRVLRLERLQLDGNICVYCGKPATEVDHIFTKQEVKCNKAVAKVRNKVVYLRSLCKPCHLKRHGKRWAWDEVMEFIERNQFAPTKVVRREGVDDS